jgi:hypothetical protein
MNVEIGAEAPQFPEKEYTAVAVWYWDWETERCPPPSYHTDFRITVYPTSTTDE